MAAEIYSSVMPVVVEEALQISTDHRSCLQITHPRWSVVLLQASSLEVGSKF